MRSLPKQIALRLHQSACSYIPTAQEEREIAQTDERREKK
jgi:hypothetical protein